ncbi:hypothetical protein D2E25_1005 [Bifidobacterium goeldii]|uniref:Uncharacterized protein n=1 Tax=Bifidobacterium goeldii TaxID=2306975 RepID=A0A430FLV9_9BIFI|nr:hypothetical protein [Bifidobacterium goeldii]RSX53682.1 hypothetical protein D2E25_1005 [Bifidobacterium goeldii]
MTSVLQKIRALASAHRVAAVTIVFALLAVVVGVGRFQPVNVHYVAVFSDNSVAASEQVVFRFDDNPGYSSSATQSAFPVNGTADIRVDSLNVDSASLVIATASSKAVLQRLDAIVAVGDRTLYTAASVDGSAFTAGSHADGERGSFTLDQQRLAKFERTIAFRSETKLFLLTLLLIAYVIALCRVSVLRALDRRYVAFGTVVVLLIGGFLANTWLVKQPLTYQYSYAFSQTTDIDNAEPYELTQSFVAQQDELRDLRLPVSYAYSVNPDDIGNANYSTTFVNSREFRNQYLITVTEQSSGAVLYNGMLTPQLLSGDANALRAVIPVTADHAAGQTFTITIHKLDDQPATVRFQGAELASPVDSLTAASTTGMNSTSDQSASAPSFTYVNLAVGYAGYPYQAAITAIIIVLLVLLLFNWCAGRYLHGIARTAACAVNYVLLGVYACFQFLIYTRYVQGFPDEDAHLSYIAFLKQHGGIIPNFADMKVYTAPSVGVLDLSQPIEFNRLGHPPLFYQIERLLGGMTVNGSLAMFSLNRMRAISFLIGLAGIALVFYIGLTRIRKIPALHLLFGLMVVSPPNLIYTISGVSNDSMTLLAVSVFVLGIVRFVEQRYSLLTYVIIAIGLSMTLLSKITAAMIVGFIAVGVIIYTLVEHRGKQALLRWQFLATLPIYLIPIAYFAKLVARFHTIQPSFQKFDFAGYVQSTFYYDVNHRMSMSVWQYAQYFTTSFLQWWHSLAGNTSVGKPSIPLYSIDRVAVMAVLLTPLLMVFMKKSRQRTYFLIAETSILLTVLYQAISAFKGFHTNGYPGAFSSRYYLCAIAVFALAIMWMICQCFSQKDTDTDTDTDAVLASAAAETVPTSHKATKTSDTVVPLTQLGTAICLTAIILLVFDGFIYSVLYYANTITGFTGIAA